jgi:hypothetical protein
VRKARQLDRRDPGGVVVQQGARAFFSGKADEGRDMFAQKQRGRAITS